jgi:hypothetical protein
VEGNPIEQPFMRPMALLLGIVSLIHPAAAETRVSVAQLEQFLRSSPIRKLPDAELAARLNSVRLEERLTEPALQHLLAGTGFGPRTLEMLELLRSCSQLMESPRSDWLPDAAPSSDVQQQMVDSAKDFAQNALRSLPDFVAVRRTRTFNNEPQAVPGKHSKPKVQLHWVQERQRQIAYLSGRENLDAMPGNRAPEAVTPANSESFTNWGEFGPILRIVLSDSFKGSVTWSHWERNAAGNRTAVLQYAVPKSASHYSVDWYLPQEHGSRFRDKPAYHGDLYFDPAAGTITDVTLIADFEDDSEMAESGLAVEYGKVRIGAKDYICPLHSVAISAMHSEWMKSLDEDGLEKFINEISFTDYHKFGSTARIVPAD